MRISRFIAVEIEPHPAKYVDPYVDRVHTSNGDAHHNRMITTW